jgi:hypothetical protein
MKPELRLGLERNPRLARAAHGFPKECEMTISARHDSSAKKKAHHRKRQAHRGPAVSGVHESAVKSADSAARFFTFTLDADTAHIVKLESMDASGASHVLSDDEKASLAKAASDRLEDVLEQVFEAGIACVLGGEADHDKGESEEDVELRRLLLKPLIEQSAAKHFMNRDVLNRTILETLIERSVKLREASTEGGNGGLQ